jgi:deazaflavin-dependent oxidoreductase (nitroreductase family)
MSESAAAPRYIASSSRVQAFLNRVVAGLTRAGLMPRAKRVLAVRGRKSGDWRTTPVNLMDYQGERYLVAPRGHTQWVRNLRSAGEGELRGARRTETFRAVELPDAEKPELLREYLRRWKSEVASFFPELTAESPVEDFARVADGYPVFRLTTV